MFDYRGGGGAFTFSPHTTAKMKCRARRETRNDNDRAEWIDSDEGLHNWWLGSRQSKRVFIRANRAAIDEVIDNVNSGRKPPVVFSCLAAEFFLFPNWQADCIL